MINKKLTYCDCGKSLGKRLNSRKLESVKYVKGEPTKTVISHTGDRLNIYCKKCNKNTSFMVNEAERGLSYAISRQYKLPLEI
jgi:hypothetical protein